MKSTMFVIVLSVSLLTSLPAQTLPQQPSSPKAPGEDEVVRVTTNLVQIDAVVTDKSGKQVNDLRPEDFEILEDGRAQKITNFSYVSTSGQPSNSSPSNATTNPLKNPPLPATPLSREKVRRTIVMAVDDLGLSLQSMDLVKSALKRFVNEYMQPGDLVAIVRTSGGTAALQQLTSDRQQLQSNIDHLRWSCRNRVGTRALGPKDSLSGLKTGQCAPIPGVSETVRALTFIADGLKTLPGRKTMLFFTDSFEIFQSPSSIGRDDTVKARIDPDHIDESIDRMMPTGGSLIRNYTEDINGLVLRLIDDCNAASTVIYSIDARGLLVTGPTAQDTDETTFSVTNLTKLLDKRREDVWETQTGLLYVAHQTSGFTVLNNNDLGKGIDRIMDDLKGYYLIGYRPSDATFAKQKGAVPYHQLSLRMLRPGLRVRSRRGFYGTTASVITNEAPLTKEQRMVAAVESPFAAGDIRFRLTALFVNMPQSSFVRTLLHIDARDLTFKEMPDGWHQADIDVIASSYGENGLIADYLSRTETIRARGKTYASLLRYGLNYNLLIPIKKPGPYQLRAAVRDAVTNRIGSAYQFIEVPDLKKGRLALSGIALSSTVLDLAALSSNSGVYNAPPDNGEDVQPTLAVRRFKPGMLLDYRYVVYNALAGSGNSLPDLTAQIRLFRDGQVVTSKEEPAEDPSRLQFDLKRLSARGRLRLGDDLIPGNYVLQILVTDPRAKGQTSTASQSIDFEVVK